MTRSFAAAASLNRNSGMRALRRVLTRKRKDIVHGQIGKTVAIGMLKSQPVTPQLLLARKPVPCRDFGLARKRRRHDGRHKRKNLFLGWLLARGLHVEQRLRFVLRKRQHRLGNDILPVLGKTLNGVKGLFEKVIHRPI